MNFAVTALVGLSLAQPPAAPDYYPMNTRTIKLPVVYKKDRGQIRMVQLFVSRGENMWTQEAEVPPDREAFVYTARDDGVYWFQTVTVDLQGNRDPQNVTTEVPELKVLVDTTRPVIQFTNTRRNGEEVIVEWEVRDRFPDENATRVYFRPASAAEGFWQEVTLPANSRTGVRFPCGTSGPIVVRVVARDLAGNVGEGLRDIAAAGAPTPNQPNATSTSMSPVTPPPVSVAPPGPTAGPGIPPLPPPSSIVPTTPATPPAVPSGPSPIAQSGPAAPAAPTGPATPPVPGPGHMAASGQGAPPAAPNYQPPTPSYQPGPPSYQPNYQPPPPVPDPRQPVVPAAPSGYSASGPTVLASGSGQTGVPRPGTEGPRAQVINFTQFNLNYEVEQRGPSGVSRVDLWVTRDDGRSWVKWSQHEGRDSTVPVRVALGDVRNNAQLEGLYGFRLVAVSGAGLSNPAPAAGDFPDVRVIVDVTPPVVKIFEPGSDPTMRDTLVIQWEATDPNFGDEPISLEWAEQPNGPWRPVVMTGGEGVVPATAVGGVMARRVPNTGRYAWRVPLGLPAKVYLKVSAQDAGGNTTDVVTPTPILVDLAKPRAKITGIGMPSPVPRP